MRVKWKGGLTVQAPHFHVPSPHSWREPKVGHRFGVTRGIVEWSEMHRSSLSSICLIKECDMLQKPISRSKGVEKVQEWKSELRRSGRHKVVPVAFRIGPDSFELSSVSLLNYQWSTQ
jgi:hypothetical protein